MSQNSQKIKYQGYPSNAVRGHTDFGQGGYPQQYSYAPSLSSVPGNSSHDLSKQVAAGQPGMYTNSGGMPTAAQHHQSVVGAVPPPQPGTYVQQGQQMNRATPLAIQGYYQPRANVPRSMPNMGRNQLTTVVNQTSQQPSQFSHLQMVPTAPYPHMQQMIVNPQISYQRPYSTGQYVIQQPSIGYNCFPQGFTNPPQPSSNNGYYLQHGMSTYNTIQSQMPASTIPAQPTQTKRESKACKITHPDTGEEIKIDTDATDQSARPPIEKEVEATDPTVCIQFAKQVALTMTENQNETLTKLQPVDDARVMSSQILMQCPLEVEPIIENSRAVLTDIDSPGELGDTESISDIDYVENRNLQCSDEPSVILYNQDIDPHSINECTYNEICVQDIDSIPVSDLRDPKMYDMVVSEEHYELDSGQSITMDSVEIQDSILVPEEPLEVFEVQEVQVQSIVELENVQVDNTVVAEVKEESKIPDVISVMNEVISSDNSFHKSSDKSASEGKKKTKKKNINKKGESKEGGEMDAFLDTKQEEAPISLPPLTATAPVPVLERMPSPVPIVDSEILSTIPLPGESFDNFPLQNDISPTSESSSISPSAESEDKENTAEEIPKIVLKYSYKEDQWSPLNPEGKKQYDRNFLLQLQSQPMSLCKPTNLPNLDVIKDKAHIQRLTEVNRAVPPMIPQIRPPFMPNDPFMPNYARGPPRLPHTAVNRRSQQGRGEKPKKVILFTSSLTQNIKLHESENAWKPLSKLEQSQEIGVDQLEKEKLKRSVQGVLNKLTPQKFETLLTQLKNLNIDTEEKLTVVIDLIFEKAIDEPNFSVPYANLCKHLALVKVPVKPEQGPQGAVNFRKLLLTKCQKEFEQDTREELKNEERMKDIEAAEPEKRKELQMEFDAEEKKLRYRQLGNIRFIGELFKLNMLIEPIMHDCIRKLLTQNDDESLECLCKLLKTIGKELDEKGNKNARGENLLMDGYFTQMQKIVEHRLTSSRVRFMLQDVIDLKRNNWIPRRDENNPKTIDQIHKEAELEAREQQQNLQNMSNYPKRVPDERERRKTPGRNVAQSDDGWTASSKSSKGSYSVLDPTKLKLTKPDELETVRLGPGGRGLSSWGRGSSGGNKAPDTEKTALTNRYSALAETSMPAPNYEGRRGSQRSAASSRESSRGRSNQLPTPIRKTPSTSKERENLLETVKGLARANEARIPDVQKNVDVHINGKAAEPDDLSLRGPSYTEEEMEKKTKPLIDEFLHNNDFEEAIKCVTELASPNTVHFFIVAAINQVLERSSQARYSLGQLLSSLLKKKIIMFEQYQKGCGSLLEMIDDYAVDIPLIWDYMGEILEPLIEDSEFSFVHLKEVLHPCIPSETAGMLVSAILHVAAKRKGTIKLGEVWRESGLHWTDFLGKDMNVNEFIKKHKLEFTICPTKVKPNTQLTIEEIKKKLLSMLEKNEGSEEIFDWIDANVQENTETNFIRALVTSVHESVISGSDARCKLDVSKLKERAPLLTRYIQHNENLELQALYAIQSLMNQLGQPNGVLHQIFDVLYDDDVITEETFKAWESSDDPNETEGKGVAVHSVKSFFTWLREADDEAEE